ncbi:hypothetical protein QNI16_10095 [Cytophagaceae bacterium YF14B1]|uniref:Zinc ribbon domain-containing protein n=1 Tax=Xanthocytophaga flava TaxID=3048013 RepID=A0AAE3QQE7_9BACT|nr:hypothetical protein [Xanthocytophaga flavus]MDJ1480833.1 hypothetical protein [Xanthocytophaga flavus]
MISCKQCGVELETQMKSCPLCGTVVGEAGYKGPTATELNLTNVLQLPAEDKHVLKHLLWQIVAILLFSGILATLLIDLMINHHVTWAVYPLCFCTILLSYAALLAFWHKKTMYQILVGWLASTLVLWLLYYLFPFAGWLLYLGIPILFSVNFILLALMSLFHLAGQKGLNLLAYTFVAIALLGLLLEGIISYYVSRQIRLSWSVIVAACLFPVITALFFMFYRMRNQSVFQKIFHT